MGNSIAGSHRYPEGFLLKVGYSFAGEATPATNELWIHKKDEVLSSQHLPAASDTQPHDQTDLTDSILFSID